VTDYAAALEAVDGILERGGDADDVLRSVLVTLHEHGVEYAAIRFVESGQLVGGPSVGAGEGTTVPVRYEGDVVGELEASVEAGADGVRFLERVAALVSAHVLVGWDTGGDAWSP
jgi:hypothetical protein